MNTQFFKRTIGVGIGWLFEIRPRRSVLLYHAFSTSQLAVSSGQFEEQIRWLSLHSQVMGLNRLVEGVGEGPSKVALTFDDAYASVFDIAFPLLQKHGFVGTVYVNPGSVHDTVRTPSNPDQGHYPNEQFMTWSELRQLSAAGWSIGGHGIDHVDLTKVDKPTLRHQVAGCKSQIESKLGGPCVEFAYTWGRHTADVRDAVRQAGYHSAVAGLHGPVTRSSDTFALPRLDIRSEYSLSDFQAVVKGSWDFLSYVQKWRGR